MGAAPLHWDFGQMLTSIPNAHTAPKARGSQPWAGHRDPALAASHSIPVMSSTSRPAQSCPGTSISSCYTGKRQGCSGATRTTSWSQVMEPAPGVLHLQLPSQSQSSVLGEGTLEHPRAEEGGPAPCELPLKIFP